MAQRATAVACSNIAFCKYWGNTNHALRLPVSGSISMNLGGLYTRTTVHFNPELRVDCANVDGKEMLGGGLERISKHLDFARQLAGITTRAEVLSENNFPTGAGIASSASAFAALSVASAAALNLSLTERELSAYARLGSGSASRSIPGGFVEWYLGTDHASSYAESIAPADHWALTDLVAIVSTAHKATGSTEGHQLADTSPLQSARVASASERITRCRNAILSKDFEAFASVVELDSDIMHAVMQTSTPPLLYWLPATVAIMRRVRELRADGIGVCYTIDAGANVHCMCAPGESAKVRAALEAIQGVTDIRVAMPGSAAYVERVG